jgi:hypothetical protein
MPWGAMKYDTICLFIVFPITAFTADHRQAPVSGLELLFFATGVNTSALSRAIVTYFISLHRCKYI